MCTNRSFKGGTTENIIEEYLSFIITITSETKYYIYLFIMDSIALHNSQ
jgi:hypothetical protein